MSKNISDASARISAIPAVDVGKRKTLKGIGVLAASSALSVSGAVIAKSAFSVSGEQAAVSLAPIDLEITLVSIPDREGETLQIRNLTNQDISISQFDSGRVLFHGDVVDCNDACATGTIVVPAKQNVIQQFDRQFAKNLNLPHSNYLAADSSTQTLSQGTRVVKLFARSQGGTAQLFITPAIT